MLKRFIFKTLDRLYLPFIRKYIPYVTFRYAACGGGNMFFNWMLYGILYNFIFAKQNVELGFVTISPHIAAFMVAFAVTFFTGFWLNKNIAFEHSPLGSGTKMFRYLMVICTNMLINYFGLKLLVETIGVYPTPSYIAISLITIVFSYLAQKNFTFRS